MYSEGELIYIYQGSHRQGKLGKSKNTNFRSEKSGNLKKVGKFRENQGI